MKKFFLLAAVAMFAFAACDDPANEGNDPKNDAPEVKTCAENLVAYFPLESAENAVKAEGITFNSKAGAADFKTGEIGKGYSNTAGNNDEAYFKFNLAKENALSSLKDVTITLWAKNIEEFQKGGLLSANGKLFETQDWPSLVLLFDNKNTVKDEAGEDTGVKTQQINGRIMFKKDDGSETNLWLDTWDPAFAKYATWFQIAFTYVAETGVWALYVDGVKVKDAEYGDKMDFGKCIPADANALYIGGWASRIEKYTGAQDWMCSFSGSIDEIRIFNKALTEEEIQALRKEELAIALS